MRFFSASISSLRDFSAAAAFPPSPPPAIITHQSEAWYTGQHLLTHQFAAVFCRPVRRRRPQAFAYNAYAIIRPCHPLSRLDYGSATLHGIPFYLVQRIQAVMNAATWMTYSTSWNERVTPLLHHLHWLKAPQQIAFMLLLAVLIDNGYINWHWPVSLMNSTWR